MSEKAHDRIVGKISESDFYRRDHAIIFRVLHHLHSNGVPTDAVTVGEQLERMGFSEAVGGTSYILEIANNTPSAANVLAYADIVREKSVFRMLADISGETLEIAFNSGSSNANEVLSELIGKLLKMQKVEAKYEHTLQAAVRAAVLAAKQAMDTGGLPGLTYGVSDLDDTLGGLHNSDLVVLGARPSMGKTAVMLNFSMNCGVSCGIISAEQGHMQIGQRVLASESNVIATRFRSGTLNAEDLARTSKAVHELTDRKVWIYDKSAPHIDEIIATARRWKSEFDIKALFVDYIQRIEAGNGKMNKLEVVGIVTRQLKTLARELDIPVFALAQVKRAVEDRSNKRPLMGDLADSSEIEKEADVIMLLYRDEVYDENTNDKGIAELIIAKNRSGPVGTIRAQWSGQMMKIRNLAYDRDAEPAESNGEQRRIKAPEKSNRLSKNYENSRYVE